MKKLNAILSLLLLILILLSGCSEYGTDIKNNNLFENDTSNNNEQITSNTAIENHTTEDNRLSGGQFNINFKYTNNLYGYKLDATWSNVEILFETPAFFNGLEILLDGTTEWFDELDLDHSGKLTQNEWQPYEEDFFYIFDD